MKYTNGFSIVASNTECFITFLENRPNGDTRITEEIETMVMTEQSARQLLVALAKVFNKVDSERAAKKNASINVKESGSQLS